MDDSDRRKKISLGLVSGNIRRGDEVWLLERLKIPLIIRRQRKGYGRPIGDAYIIVMLYEEAFRVENFVRT
ncbi:hypothetical protein V8E51_004921 [Hyaloscypha variabilis]|jgi:hypothetical protein